MIFTWLSFSPGTPERTGCVFYLSLYPLCLVPSHSMQSIFTAFFENLKSGVKAKMESWGTVGCAEEEKGGPDIRCGSPQESHLGAVSASQPRGCQPRGGHPRNATAFWHSDKHFKHFHICYLTQFSLTYGVYLVATSSKSFLWGPIQPCTGKVCWSPRKTWVQN